MAKIVYYKLDTLAGKLSVVSGIDDKGKLKTTEATTANHAAFLKFSNKDGLLKNFMKNFLKQFNNPSHFGLYKVLADNVELGVDNLRMMLLNRETPENKRQLSDSQVRFEDFLPKQKNAATIDPEKVDWKQLDRLGLSREQLEQNGELEKMLNWLKSNLMTIAIPMGDTTIYTDARLAFRTDGNTTGLIGRRGGRLSDGSNPLCRSLFSRLRGRTYAGAVHGRRQYLYLDGVPTNLPGLESRAERTGC